MFGIGTGIEVEGGTLVVVAVTALAAGFLLRDAYENWRESRRREEVERRILEARGGR